jgi:hypothetical protein
MGRRLSMATRKELIEAVGKRYRAGTQRQRREILDEFVRLTGYHRKHPIRVLATPARTAPARTCERLYDEAVKQTLIVLREAADRICGKRLKALLPTLIEAMESHGHLHLAPGGQDKALGHQRGHDRSGLAVDAGAVERGTLAALRNRLGDTATGTGAHLCRSERSAAGLLRDRPGRALRRGQGGRELRT